MAPLFEPEKEPHDAVMLLLHAPPLLLGGHRELLRQRWARRHRDG
jgi:hypothetical protein